MEEKALYGAALVGWTSEGKEGGGEKKERRNKRTKERRREERKGKEKRKKREKEGEGGRMKSIQPPDPVEGVGV